MAALGCKIPTTGTLPADVGLATMGQLAERSGAQSLWVSDHVVLLANAASRYPYSTDGDPNWAPDVPWLEAFASMAWLAASTTTATIGSAVLVLPQRNPVVVAKMAATIDVLSGGRVVLGVGAGWLREEFEVLGWDFATRGRRLEEAMSVLRACWTGAPPARDTEFFSLPEGVLCHPTPAQAQGIPLLVGGMTERAIRRAASLGDGWLALVRIDSVDEQSLAAMLDQARALRAPHSPPFRTAISLIGKIEERDLPLLGRMAGLGFDDVLIDVGWRDLDAAQATIRAAAVAVS